MGYYEKKYRTIRPPEGRIIGAIFDKKANEVEEQAANLERIKSALDSSWEGNSKKRFMASFENSPSAIRAYAAELRAKADIIRSIEVEEEYYIYVEDDDE